MKQATSHPYHLHGIRVLLFGVLLSALFLVRIDTPLLSVSSEKSGVLAYATNVNTNDLLAATNAFRAQNGLAALALSSQLNNSSQGKAQHMIDNNYWAHVAPDGTQPWYFFNQAGYSYITAGENLAYGFGSSSAVVDAWINSPSHKANILGDYADVGFGYANGANYQSGQNTVVVAHYGKQHTAPPPPPAPAQTVTPPPAPPAQTPVPTPASPPPTATVPIPEPSTPSEPTQETPSKEVAQDKPTDATVPAPINTASTKSVSLWESLGRTNPPFVAIASIAMTVFAAAGFALTHRSLMQHAVANGERFIVKHPAIDMTVVVAISILILTTTISRIG